MAEQKQKEKEVSKRSVHLKNTSPKGQRFVFDATGKQHLIGPGEEVEVEVAEPVAKSLEDQSKAGSDLVVQGSEAPEPEKQEGAPETPKEHKSRTALAAAEAELMEEGQQADRERKEKDAKKSGEQLARETGIHMHARGLKPEVVASPPDAPKKKK